MIQKDTRGRDCGVCLTFAPKPPPDVFTPVEMALTMELIHGLARERTFNHHAPKNIDALIAHHCTPDVMERFREVMEPVDVLTVKAFRARRRKLRQV